MGAEILSREVQTSETVMTDKKIVSQCLEGHCDSKKNTSSALPTRMNLVKLVCGSVFSIAQQG